MANTTLPLLAASTAVSATDLILMRQGGTSDTKTTITQLMTYVNANVSVAATQLTGTLQAAQFPAISGDITISAGSLTAAITAGVIVNADINASAAIDATKIANGSVSNAEFQYLDGVTSAIQTQLNGKAATSQVDVWSMNVATVANQDYIFHINLPFACTINEVTTKSASGTCTAQGKINTTALGGAANSVTTTESTQTHTTANTMVVGDDFTITVTSNSACTGMIVSVKYTRTLA